MAAASSASSGTSAASLSVTPATPLAGDGLVLSGCGYTPGVAITAQAVFNTKASTIIVQVGETVDANGCFSTSDFPYVVSSAGKWTASVWESGHKDATLVFTVG